MVGLHEVFFHHPVIGVDIGQYTIKMVQIIAKRKGKYEIHAWAGSRNQSHNLEYLVEDIKKVYQQGHFKGQKAVICLPQEELLFDYVTLPPTSEEELSHRVEWEAKIKFPFLAKKGNFDFKVCGERTLVVASETPVLPLKKLIDRAGLDVVAVEGACFAWLRAWDFVMIHKSMKHLPYRIIVDIGWKQNRLLLAEYDQPLLFRSMNLGGESLTNALIDVHQLDWDQAEAKKCGGHFFCNEEPFKGWINRLINDIRCFMEEGKKKYPGMNDCSILLLGGGANLMGLPEALQIALDMPVEKSSAIVKDYRWGMENEREEIEKILPLFAESLGLALREVEGDEN